MPLCCHFTGVAFYSPTVSGYFLQQQTMQLCWSTLWVDFDAIQCISTVKLMQASYQPVVDGLDTPWFSAWTSNSIWRYRRVVIQQIFSCRTKPLKYYYIWQKSMWDTQRIDVYSE